MTLAQAFIAMLDGKKVTNINWVNKKCYIVFNPEEGLACYSGYTVGPAFNEGVHNALYNLDEYHDLDEGWKVVE